MKCPFCKSVLKNGDLKRYETLVEHGFDPNKEVYPLRPTSICKCEMSKDCFWAGGGSFYSSKTFNHKLAKEIYGNNSFPAIGSWSRYQENQDRLAKAIRKCLFFVNHKFDCSYKIANFLFKFLPKPNFY